VTQIASKTWKIPTEIMVAAGSAISISYVFLAPKTILSHRKKGTSFCATCSFQSLDTDYQRLIFQV